MKFPEEFQIPSPPRTEPSSLEDATPVRESENVKQQGAWNLASGKPGWQDLCGRQVLLTVVAFSCWTIMCIFDLFGWPTSPSYDVASPALSLSVLTVSCIAFATRYWCLPRILQQDPTGSPGQCKLQYQLLILLASQWLLLSGAIIWLVFHASSQRHPQVIAGVVAVMILLVLLLCSLVYMLQRTSAVKPQKEHPNVARISQASEDLALASVDADLTDESFVPARSPSLDRDIEQAVDTQISQISDTSDNFIGHVMSGVGTASPSGRSSLRLKVRVDIEPDDIEKQLSDESEVRHRNSKKSVDFEKEIYHSSRGRWRPLFPTFMVSSMSNPPTPTMSRTSMLSLGEPMRRGNSIRSSRFRFETEAEVEQCLEKEIKRHTLEVNSVLQRSTSPSPSLGSLPSMVSQQSGSKKVKSSRASSSSGLTDTSG